MRVTITGGDPVGLAFALLLADLMGPRVAIRIYNGRWKQDGDRVVWKVTEEGNVHRLQVVTIQSRQFRKLPQHVQDHLFTPGNFTEMWPAGPDSVNDVGPRNIPIAYVEDRLLDLRTATAARSSSFPSPSTAESARAETVTQHVLAICEGSRSRTFTHFQGKFGAADHTFYGDRRRPTLRHGARPASEVAAARPDGGTADGSAEPVPAELAERRGLPEHAAHRA